MNYDTIRNEIDEMLKRLAQNKKGEQYQIGILQTLLTVAMLEMKPREQGSAIRLLKNIS